MHFFVSGFLKITLYICEDAFYIRGFRIVIFFKNPGKEELDALNGRENRSDACTG